MTWTMIPFVILCAAPWVVLYLWRRDVKNLHDEYAKQLKADKQEGEK
jgi:hypothetical protein